jgi:hypothetical protein
MAVFSGKRSAARLISMNECLHHPAEEPADWLTEASLFRRRWNCCSLLAVRGLVSGRLRRFCGQLGDPAFADPLNRADWLSGGGRARLVLALTAVFHHIWVGPQFSLL